MSILKRYIRLFFQGNQNVKNELTTAARIHRELLFKDEQLLILDILKRFANAVIEYIWEAQCDRR